MKLLLCVPFYELISESLLQSVFLSLPPALSHSSRRLLRLFRAPSHYSFFSSFPFQLSRQLYFSICLASFNPFDHEFENKQNREKFRYTGFSSTKCMEHRAPNSLSNSIRSSDTLFFPNDHKHRNLNFLQTPFDFPTSHDVYAINNKHVLSFIYSF